MLGQHHIMLSTVCSSYLQEPKRRLQSSYPKNAYTDCRELNWEKDNTCRIHIFMWCSFESSSHNCFSADDSSSDDSASSDASEFCPSHEDETSDEFAELLMTEESEFGCQDNPECFLLHFRSSRWIFFILHVLHNALVSLVVLQILCDRQRASLFVSCGDGVLCLRVGR